MSINDVLSLFKKILIKQLEIIKCYLTQNNVLAQLEI